MKHILIDSDVILDFFFDRKPYSNHAAEILSYCEQGKINGFLTPVIISNIYYLLRREASHNKVTNSLKQLLKIIRILQMNETVVMQALESDFKDFEDALQNYTAVENGDIDAIITRNIKDYKKSELSIMTPENFLRLIDSSQA